MKSKSQYRWKIINDDIYNMSYSQNIDKVQSNRLCLIVPRTRRQKREDHAERLKLEGAPYEREQQLVNLIYGTISGVDLGTIMEI